jgi:hypothetical protein
MHANKSSSIRRVLSRVVIAAAVLSSVGCTATVATSGRARFVYSDPVVYVDTAPDVVYRSPRTDYHGRPAYLVNGRWYYQSDGGWVYFEREPTELRRYRVDHERRDYRPQPRRYSEPREGVRRRYYD